jgi:hypothetical protein
MLALRCSVPEDSCPATMKTPYRTNKFPLIPLKL